MVVGEERRSPALLVSCAAVGLGVLALLHFNVIVPLYLFGTADEPYVPYVQAAALLLALLVWHVSPRSWGVLVTLGALCAAPAHVLLLWPELFGEWVRVPYFVVDAAARPLLLVGLLGVATAVWRAGRHGAGAVLFGATLVVPAIASLVVPTFVVDLDNGVPVTMLVLVGAVVALTVPAALTASRQVEPEVGPEWQVTVGGIVAGAAPTVFYVWRAPDPDSASGDADDLYAEFSQHFLVVGLVVLGIGLLGGIVAGLRVLVAGAAAGLLLGAVSVLAGEAAVSIGSLTGGLAAAVGVLVLAVGVGVALPRVRAVLGVAGLGVVIVGLVVTWLVFAERTIADTDAVHALTTTLAAITIIAGVAVCASLGTVVASAGEAPAAFAGVAAAVTAGVSGIALYYRYGVGTTASPRFLESNYPPALVFLVLATVLTVVAHRLGRRTPPRPATPEPVFPAPVG
jgi:hypothetical protein